MQDVIRLELEMIGFVEFDVEFVNGLDIVSCTKLLVESWMHKTPGPLLTNNANGFVRRRQLLLDVVPDLDGKNDNHHVTKQN